MPINDELLIALYEEQDLTPEKLAGSNELIRLSDNYRVTSGGRELYSNTDLLQRLLDLRKSGKLPRKTDRAIKKPRPEGWPPYKQLKRSESNQTWYEVKIAHQIGFNDIIAVLMAHMIIYGNPRPVTRAEVFRLVQKYVPMGYVATDSNLDKEDCDKIESIAKQLFPELCQG